MKLVTERLILREPRTEKDAREIARGIGNLEISKWLLVVPYPYTMKDARWYLRHCKEKAKKKPRTDYGFNIELREIGELIGGIGVHHIDRKQKTAEVGYWLSQNYWRQGIVSEALERVLEFAFGRLKLRRLAAEVFTGNEKSAGILKKFGFEYEGTKKQAVICKATGKIHDAEIYGLLAKNYRRKHGR